MDFVRSYFNEMNHRQIEHFFPNFLTGQKASQSKIEKKSVQLVRGSFVPK